MAAETKDKTCYHKVASVTGAAGTLESLFAAAIVARPMPLARLHHDLTGSLFHTINSYRLNQTMHCGTLVRYTQGQHQLAVELDPKAQDLPIEQIAAAEPNAKKKKEFLDGICSFGIQGNHVLAIQSKNVSMSDLKEHITWLISETVKKTIAVEFADYVLPTNQARPVSDIKKLSIVSSLESTPVAPPGAQDAAKKSRKKAESEIVNVVSGANWEAVKTFFKQFGAPVPKGVEFKGPLSPKDIEIKLELRWKRRKSNERERVLETLARSLDSADGLDYEMEFNDNTWRRGRELKLVTELPIIFVNGIPQPVSAYEQMLGWLQRLIAEHKVSAKV